MEMVHFFNGVRFTKEEIAKSINSIDMKITAVKELILEESNDRCIGSFKERLSELNQRKEELENLIK